MTQHRPKGSLGVQNVVADAWFFGRQLSNKKQNADSPLNYKGRKVHLSELGIIRQVCYTYLQI